MATKIDALTEEEIQRVLDEDNVLRSLKLGEFIGGGGFAQVYAVEDPDHTTEPCVLKIVDMAYSFSDQFEYYTLEDIEAHHQEFIAYKEWCQRELITAQEVARRNSPYLMPLIKTRSDPFSDSNGQQRELLLL